MQDYGLAIRIGNFQHSLKLLYLIYIGFVLLEKTYYISALGLHLLLMEYQRGSMFPLFDLVDLGHPSFATQTQNFRNFNGEDIECFNRKLSQATVSNSVRSQVLFLSSSFGLV